MIFFPYVDVKVSYFRVIFATRELLELRLHTARGTPGVREAPAPAVVGGSR